jgi:hypothetical protein
MRLVSSIARYRSRLIILPAILIAVGSALVINHGLPVHSQLSRQTVIDATVNPGDRHLYGRVEAKLMHRSDLQHGDTEFGSNGQPNQLIWVVAVSGNYGIAPSFGCCGGPADYHGKNTWGIAIIPDAPGKPVLREFEASWHGDWPPFFDGLPDLYTGK